MIHYLRQLHPKSCIIIHSPIQIVYSFTYLQVVEALLNQMAPTTDPLMEMGLSTVNDSVLQAPNLKLHKNFIHRYKTLSSRNTIFIISLCDVFIVLVV